jgi:negative regulator of flagellin synthesis FlgM
MDPINNATSSAAIQPSSTPATNPNTGSANVTTSTNNAAGTSSAASTSGAAAAPTSSSVTNLSSISTQIQAAQATSGSDAVFSTSKVSEIKQAISEGRFQVNSSKVADGLLDSVHDLLGSRSRS